MAVDHGVLWKIGEMNAKTRGRGSQGWVRKLLITWGVGEVAVDGLREGVVRVLDLGKSGVESLSPEGDGEGTEAMEEDDTLRLRASGTIGLVEDKREAVGTESLLVPFGEVGDLGTPVCPRVVQKFKPKTMGGGSMVTEGSQRSDGKRKLRQTGEGSDTFKRLKEVQVGESI